MSPPRPPARAAMRPALDGLLLFRIGQLFAVAGGMVIRLCEGRFGITRREWRLLAKLVSEGDLSPSDLAVQVRLDRSRTSKAVVSLVAKGLVSRSARGGDRRQALLSVTPAGLALYDELFPLVSDINEQLLGCLAPEERRAFDEALACLQRRAVQLNADAQAVLPKADRGRRAAKA